MLSPKARKATKKKLKAHLKAQAECAKSKRQKEQLQQTLTLVEEPHLRRPRCAYFGEMLQMDASQHRWFGEQITHLHAAIDDATETIVGAYFDTQETLHGYYTVFHQILTDYGIPYLFYTDRRTVFEYKKLEDEKKGSIKKHAMKKFRAISTRTKSMRRARNQRSATSQICHILGRKTIS